MVYHIYFQDVISSSSDNAVYHIYFQIMPIFCRYKLDKTILIGPY